MFSDNIGEAIIILVLHISQSRKSITIPILPQKRGGIELLLSLCFPSTYGFLEDNLYLR